MNQLEILRECLEDIESKGWTFQIFARQRATEALVALKKIAEDYYTAADMADAQAKAFRDGVASVLGEPAWYHKHWGQQDDIFYRPTDAIPDGATPLYAAPVAQQQGSDHGN